MIKQPGLISLDRLEPTPPSQSDRQVSLPHKLAYKTSQLNNQHRVRQVLASCLLSEITSDQHHVPEWLAILNYYIDVFLSSFSSCFFFLSFLASRQLRSLHFEKRSHASKIVSGLAVQRNLSDVFGGIQHFLFIYLFSRLLLENIFFKNLDYLKKLIWYKNCNNAGESVAFWPLRIYTFLLPWGHFVIISS